MRYYALTLKNASGQTFVPDPNGNGFIYGAGPTFTSYVNGKTLPGALNIEFNVPTYNYNTPQGNSIIRVWGIGLKMIGQSADLNGGTFTLAAGMQKGLPLAKPDQSGVLIEGLIYQAFGNWSGVNQTLDIICNPGASSFEKDISFVWPPGMALDVAIEAVVAQAFAATATTPAYTPDINIARIVQTGDGSGHYTSLQQLATYITNRSQKIGAKQYGDNYSGVLMYPSGSTIVAYDSTTSASRKTTMINFEDLIGQPTWINASTVNFRTVLRADLAVGVKIKFPQGITAPFALTTAAAASPNAPSRNKTAFQGTFLLNSVIHFANFRQPDADAWTTSFDAVVAT